MTPLRLRIARVLEDGAWDGPVARVLAQAWTLASARSLARPLVWDERVRVVAVGGATLGGSGKTPLAIACARALAEQGARVAFVAHGYRARPGAARVVRGTEPLSLVGDEAIVAARALAGVAPVVVAPSRQAALDHAATIADVLVLDGVLQTAPRRASLALLALDGDSPWGSGAVVPCGDLRAAKESLLSVSDRAVVLQDEDADESGGGRRARTWSRGAFVSGVLVPWSALRSLRLGLFVALARPSRLLARLARRGIVPSRVVRILDHGSPHVAFHPSAREAFPSAWAAEAPSPLAELLARPGRPGCPAPFAPPVDLWLASPKCALSLEEAGIPHGVLDHGVTLSADLRADLRDCLPGSGRAAPRLPHLHPLAGTAPNRAASLTP